VGGRTLAPGVGRGWNTFYPTMKAERPNEVLGDDERRTGVYRSCTWISASYKA